MRHLSPNTPQSRRNFLKTTGLATATSLVGIRSRAAPTRPLACRLSSYGKFESVAWSHLPALGIKYVFISVPEPDQVDATMARLKEHALTPLVMRGAADLSEASCVKTLAAQLAVCNTMGVRYMFLSPKHANAPKQTAYGYLRQAGDIAKTHNVIISLETHPDLGTNGTVHVETMKAIDHPNIRVNFDTGNITYYNEDCNAVEELKKCIEYAATVEVKDHDGALESWAFPPLGKGIVDFKGILQALDEHGYAGPVTLEFEGVKGVDLDEAGTKRAIEESIAYLRSITSFT